MLKERGICEGGIGKNVYVNGFGVIWGSILGLI